MAWQLFRRSTKDLLNPRPRASQPRVELLEDRVTPAFTVGNLVVLRVGTGAAALTNAAAPIFLDEYSHQGTLFQNNVALPATGANAITLQGTTTTEGGLNRSSDGRFLTLGGYRKNAGGAAPSLDPATTTNRVIARIAADETADTTTALTDAFTSGTFRSVASTDGSQFWTTGSRDGVRFVGALGATTSTPLGGAADNLRQVVIAGGNLYVASGATPPGRGIKQVGTGLPQSGAPGYTNLVNAAFTETYNSVFFADLDAGVAGVDTLYAVNDAFNRLEKYSLVGGVWTLKNSAALANIRYVTGYTSGSTAVLYATNGASIQRLTDTSGYDALMPTTFASVATAPGNTAFRGIAFAPNPGGNTSPYLDSTGTMTLPAINEDVDPAANLGLTVSALVATAGGDRITDADAGAMEGIAVTAVVNVGGSWEFSTDDGGTWTAFGTPSAAAARLLAANARVRFAPAADFNGAVADGLSFRAWDQTSGANGGVASVASNGGSTAFSLTTESVSITVNPISDAPVLDDAAPLVLTPPTESDTDPAGDRISDLIASAGDPITDGDAGALEGIAVTAANNGNGTWQFSLDDGSTWTAFAGLSETNARLLAADMLTRVRFVPVADFSGPVNPGLSFRAWDQTNGTAGSTADVSVNGTTTAFSTATGTVVVTVTNVNDAPVLTPVGGLTLATISEDPLVNLGDSVLGLLASGGDLISDIDTGAVEGIAVTAVDSSSGVWHFSTNGGANWVPFGPTSAVTARLLAANATTRIRFVPSPNFNGALPTAITFRAWDQSAGANGSVMDATTGGGETPFSTATETASLVVLPVNDAPALDNSGDTTLPDLTEDPVVNLGNTVAGIVASAGGDRITDSDAGAVKGVAVVAVDNTSGAWEHSTDGGATWVAFGTPSATAARLLAFNALNRIRFVPNANFNGTVTNGLFFRAWDQTGGVDGGTTDVSVTGGTTPFSAVVETVSVKVTAVNDAPVLDAAGTLFLNAITEDPASNAGTLVSVVIASAGGDRITDPDAAAVEGIAVVVADNTSGSWEHSIDGGANWIAFGTPSSTAARLLAADALTRVRFVPSPNFAGTVADGLTFVAWDQTSGTNGGTADVTVLGGSTAFSTTIETAGIAVNPVNDGPVNTVPAATQTVQAGNGLVFAAANGNPISVADIDAGIGSMRVTLTATNGVLKVSGTAGLTFITGDGTDDAMMTFTGTVANVNAALAGLTFTPAAGFSGSAAVQVLTSDQGNTGSAAALADGDTVNVTVTAPPPPPVVVVAKPATTVPAAIPGVLVEYFRPRRGRLRVLRFDLAAAVSVPVTLKLRIPLRRTPGSRRVQFVTGVLTINPGETAAEFAFLVRGNPPREPQRAAEVELNDTVRTVLQTLGF